jgi:hypothetical protein
MSVSFTDINGDGVEDVFISNIAHFSFVSKYVKPGEETEVAVTRATMENARIIEDNVFLVSGEDGPVDRHREYFQRTTSGAGWAWDADFFDFDNDGLEDMYIANGREPGLHYGGERNVLYKQSEGYFYDVSSGSGADFPSNARGAVHADFDGDGDLDIIVNNLVDRAVLLRNNLQRNHWIQLKLEGTKSNRDAIGARVWLHTSKGVQTRTVRGGGGYLSKEPNTLHFGLEDREAIERIDIWWPSGHRQSVADLQVDRVHQIVESSAENALPNGGSADRSAVARIQDHDSRR